MNPFEIDVLKSGSPSVLREAMNRFFNSIKQTTLLKTVTPSGEIRSNGNAVSFEIAGPQYDISKLIKSIVGAAEEEGDSYSIYYPHYESDGRTLIGHTKISIPLANKFEFIKLIVLIFNQSTYFDNKFKGIEHLDQNSEKENFLLAGKTLNVLDRVLDYANIPLPLTAKNALMKVGSGIATLNHPDYTPDIIAKDTKTMENLEAFRSLFKDQDLLPFMKFAASLAQLN